MDTILAISGSLRKGSFNTALARAAIGFAPTDCTIELASIREIPLYDGDVEAQGMPPAVEALKDRIAQAMGFLLITPEYNNSVPGVLKNTIDWCTRGDENPLKGRVAAVVSASPGQFGGIRSMTLARQLLTHLGCHVVPAQCILPHADQAFDEKGALKDERSRKAAQAVATELVRVARALKS